VSTLILRPPTPSLFPYTTLFRSQDAHAADWTLFDTLSNRKSFGLNGGECAIGTTYTPTVGDNRTFRVFFNDGTFAPGTWEAMPRSEEHTSELQSRENLVCRLLLE